MVGRWWLVVGGWCGALGQGDLRRREFDRPPSNHVAGVVRVATLRPCNEGEEKNGSAQHYHFFEKHVVLGGNARPGCVEVFFHAANYTKNSVPLAEQMTLILDMRLTTYDGRYRHATDARRKS